MKGTDYITLPQQKTLLQVSRDFEVIGTLKYHNSSSKKENLIEIESLRRNLFHHLDSYDSRWFKSKQRKEQSEQLRGLLLEGVEKDSPQTGYEAILRSLHQAKMEAIESDRNINKNKWFKVNRSGHSRFYETLNKMQDAVLKHWAKDEKAALRLPVYREMVQEEFQDILKAFETDLAGYYRNVYLDTAVNPYTLYQRTFSKKDYRGAVTALREAIQRVSNGADDTDDRIKIRNLQEVKDMLENGVGRRLPGELQTLAKEVLTRADSMITSIELESQHTDLTKGGNLSS